jgi:hypothetical protein
MILQASPTFPRVRSGFFFFSFIFISIY